MTPPSRGSISNPHIALVGRRGLREKPPQHHRASVDLFESDQGLMTTSRIGCIKLIKVVGGHRHLCSHNARWKSSVAAAPLPVCQRVPPLLSAEEVNKRPNKTGVKAIESFFAKWSLIGPFFLADQSYDFGGESRLTHNSAFKSFLWKWATWKKWPLPKLQLWTVKKRRKKKKKKIKKLTLSRTK